MNFLVLILLCVLFAICNVGGAVLIKMELQKLSLNGFWDYFNFVLRLRVMAGFAIVFLSGALASFLL